jgi:hypothetical protein
MCSIPVEVPAAARARWLAEVAETLEQAESLLNRLSHSGRHAALITELEMRLEAAKGEVESLRGRRQPCAESGPTWTNLPPWRSNP